MINEVKKAIDRALKQVRPAFRGVTSLLNTASQVSVAQIKGVASEVLNNVPVFQQFGFTSALPDNSDVIVLPLLGSSGLSVIIASENGKFRLKGLVKGESALYSLWGDYIHIKEGRIIKVKAGTKLLVDAPDAEFLGNLKVLGNIESDGYVKDQKGTMQEIRDVYNNHGHNSSGAAQPKMNLP
ncbi:MAG TPA: phage baseplate assembly protein [Agitococcus sp.]|nr:phage baseplate assembly protein [Agitococcus sp.]